MKVIRVLFLSLFLLFACGQAFALITTDNVDRDAFQYEIGYRFATRDVGASKTGVEVYTSALDQSPTYMQDGIKYYVIPRGSTATYQGMIVGMSAYMGQACTAGSATFDVTINGQKTGIQNVINADATASSAVGITGSTGTQYSYIRHDRTQNAVEQGFRQAREIDATTYNSADNYYGRATPLVAGNRIGVKMTTSSDFSPSDADVVITVYVLQ